MSNPCRVEGGLKKSGATAFYFRFLGRLDLGSFWWWEDVTQGQDVTSGARLGTHEQNSGTGQHPPMMCWVRWEVRCTDSQAL